MCSQKGVELQLKVKNTTEGGVNGPVDDATTREGTLAHDSDHFQQHSSQICEEPPGTGGDSESRVRRTSSAQTAQEAHELDPMCRVTSEGRAAEARALINAAGGFKDFRELWGKRASPASPGFTGKPSEQLKKGLSKNEAEAALQRLVTASGTTGLDEVRQMRKLINGMQ